MTSKTAKRWREYWFPLAVGILLAAWGTVPYVHAAWTAPEGMRFMGFLGRGTNGACGYMMFARQVEAGANLLENRMTSEPLPRTYASIEWWLYGKAARWSGTPLTTMYHVERVLGAIGFALAVYFLAAQFLGSVFRRRLALLAVCFGSGLGYVLLAANELAGLHFPASLDLRGVTLAGYLINKPHFVRAAAFGALKYGFLIIGERTGRRRWFVYGGLAACGQTAIRPFHVAETHLVCILFPLLLNVREGRWNTRRFLNYMTVLAVHLPMLAFGVYFSRGNPLGVEGLTLAEGYFNPGWGRPMLFWETAFWLGVPFLMCCAALPWLLTRKGLHRPDALLAFVFLIAGLLYNAYPYWGAGLEASLFAFMTLPGVLAAGLPMTWTLRAVRRMRGRCARRTIRWSAAAVYLSLILPSTLYVYSSFFTSVSLPRADTPEVYYLSGAECRVLAWLDAQTAPGSVVLAEPGLSQYIPWVARNKVVAAHPMLTRRFAEKLADVSRFFGGDGTPASRRAIALRYGVDYVVAPKQRGWGEAEYPWLHLVHVEGGQAVYQTSF